MAQCDSLGLTMSTLGNKALGHIIDALPLDIVGLIKDLLFFRMIRNVHNTLRASYILIDSGSYRVLDSSVSVSKFARKTSVRLVQSPEGIITHGHLYHECDITNQFVTQAAVLPQKTDR
ncbi:hypothetical protein M0804_006860 [Polistes exclamans]|nr:hypothetical protein M0804_006860 [Polistes exclamans]